jgi:hypothetical protein
MTLGGLRDSVKEEIYEDNSEEEETPNKAKELQFMRNDIKQGDE